MNTFVIYESNSIVFSRVCDSPPSVEETCAILGFLEKRDPASLEYSIDIIHGNNHKKNVGIFYNIDEFFNYFKNLCKEGIKYGVVVHLNY